VIELKSSYFYESGSAEFKGEGKQILTELAERLGKPEYESFKLVSKDIQTMRRLKLIATLRTGNFQPLAPRMLFAS
jgi:hypothetical protein